MEKRTYHGYMPNDFIDGFGVSVSLWTSGCRFHCVGCQNKETWDPLSGVPVPDDIAEKIKKAITANGIQRNFSVLGGEPLAPFNREYIADLIDEIREAFPDIEIAVWTGYTIEELKKENDSNINWILSKIDLLIDGRYDDEQRDITLPLRGSRNQRLLFKGVDF